MFTIIYQTNDHPDYQSPPDKLYTCERPQRYSKSMKEYPQLLSTPWALFWFYSLSDDYHCDEVSFPNLAMIMMIIPPERLRGWQGFPKLFQWRKPDSHPRPLADLSFAREQNWPNLQIDLNPFFTRWNLLHRGLVWAKDLNVERAVRFPPSVRLFVCLLCIPLDVLGYNRYDWFSNKMLLNIINLDDLEYQ